MKDKIKNIESEQHELQKKVLTVELMQKSHFEKMDEVIESNKETNLEIKTLCSQMGVVLEKLGQVDDFKKRIGERQDKVESRANTAYSLSKSHENPIRRIDKFFDKVVYGSIVIIISLCSVILSISSKSIT